MHGEPVLLASCYRRSLEIAAAHSLRSIAFPAISCGIYGYPVELAAPLAVETCASFAAADPRIERIVFALFDARTLAVYEAALARLA
jgi:O-acetyl-ADP-ribose deacetylase (regulator of RNase III)